MTIPFIDPALIVTALTPLLDATGETPLVRDLRVLGATERAAPGAMVRGRPSIAVIPAASTAAGPAGIGNGRMLTEQVELVLQVDQLGGADASALETLRTLRQAIFALLEAQRPDRDWSPLRYQGGALVAIDNATYTWVERYATQHSLPTC